MQATINSIFLWLGERLRDLFMWPINLVRDFPIRAGWLLRTLARGVDAIFFSSQNYLTPFAIENAAHGCAQKRDCYNYGGSTGLQGACAIGRRYHQYNREQQAMITQDYYVHSEEGLEVVSYEPFITQLRSGEL